MYEILELIKTQEGWDVLVKHPTYNDVTAWMSMDNDLNFKWRDDKFDLSKVSEMVRWIVQKNDDEFINASGSIVCYLEKNHLIGGIE